MQRYRELYIDCSEEEAKSFFMRVTTALQSPQPYFSWRKDAETMGKMEDDFCFRKGLFICISYLDHDSKPWASVTLVFDPGKKQVWLSNIVPCKIGRLTIGEYNKIFGEVLGQVIQPSLRGLRYTATSETYSSHDVLSDAAWKCLDAFSGMANRGSLHPLDIQRWHAFVICVHESSSKLDSSTLKRILKEEFAWGEEEASRLVCSYEDEIALLQEYDIHRNTPK